MKQVALIGDSIRMGYEQTVMTALAGQAEVWGPVQNGGTSRRILENLQEWVLSRPLDLVHINCGLHDIKKDFGQDQLAVPLEEYTANLRTILSRIRSETKATVVWALTTPVNQAWHHQTKGFDRIEADVTAYNAAARMVTRELGIAINDLFAVVQAAGRDKLLKPDGVHFEPAGCTLLGQTVAKCIQTHLAARASAKA